MISLVAFVVIFSSAGVAGVAGSVPTGTITCNPDNYQLLITKPYEANQEIDIKIGTGKTWRKATNSDVADSGCEENSITVAPGAGGQKIFSTMSYGEDYTGATEKAKCGGTLKTWQVTTKIEYKVDVFVVVRTLIRGQINRELKYKMVVTCALTKEVTKTGQQTWKINRADVKTTDTAGNDGVITLPLQIDIFPNKASGKGIGANEITTGASVIMGNWLWVQIKENPANAFFKFVTKECSFSPSSDANKKDTFFTDYCPVGKDPDFDDFVAVTGDYDKFVIGVKAFFFTALEQDAISVACDLLICRAADTSKECTQPARTGAVTSGGGGGCNMNSRRRRNALPEPADLKSVEDNKNNFGWVERRVVTSKQTILVDRNDVIVPTCGGDFVYDRIARTCSNENLLEISGLYLDLPWNIEYANTSSKTFKDFARGKAYQLYVLTQMTDGGKVIVGLEVVGAKKGSVILTVRIKYSATSDAASAFEVFQRAVYSSERNRATNVLNIRTEKVIEYVEVKRPSPSSGFNVENLTLIIVIVVLCIAVFISVVAVLKVRNARRGTSKKDVPEIKAHDNPNFS